MTPAQHRLLDDWSNKRYNLNFAYGVIILQEQCSESDDIHQETLCQVQNCQAQRCFVRDLRESET